MALRFPTMYSGKSLVHIAKFPNMTSPTGFYQVNWDGLFSTETIIHMFDHRHPDRIKTAIQQPRGVRYEGLEPYLDGEPMTRSSYGN